MNLVAAAAPLFVVTLLACGGETTGSPGGSSSSSGGGGASRPTPGTPGCEPSSGCVLCSDELWHCAGAGTAADAGVPSCTSCGKTACVICPAGSTEGAMCSQILNPGGDNDVESTSVHVTCSQ